MWRMLGFFLCAAAARICTAAPPLQQRPGWPQAPQPPLQRASAPSGAVAAGRPPTHAVRQLPTQYRVALVHLDAFNQPAASWLAPGATPPVLSDKSSREYDTAKGGRLIINMQGGWRQDIEKDVFDMARNLDVQFHEAVVLDVDPLERKLLVGHVATARDCTNLPRLFSEAGAYDGSYR